MGGGDSEGEIGRGGIGGWVGRNRKYRISRYRLLLLGDGTSFIFLYLIFDGGKEDWNSLTNGLVLPST